MIKKSDYTSKTIRVKNKKSVRDKRNEGGVNKTKK
jgi:hypothetical protein